jgi:molecular chaperone GrpE
MTLSKEDKEKRFKGTAPEKPTTQVTAGTPQNIQELPQQLEEKTKEAQEYYDRLLRLAADLENLKKRQERERAELLQFANEKLLKDLLPVVDNLELALDHGRQSEAPASFLEGIDLVYQGFLKVLARFGVTPIASVGQQFDPAFHNAVLQEEAPEVPDCTVLKELQKGYLLQNRLLRPAMVVVARNTDKTACQIDSKVQEEK